MLSRIIVSSFQALIELSIWLVLIGGLVGGWQSKGLLGALFGLLSSFVFCIVVFGAFLILADIHKTVRSIESKVG